MSKKVTLYNIFFFFWEGGGAEGWRVNVVVQFSFFFLVEQNFDDSEKFLSVTIIASTAYETDKYMGAAICVQLSQIQFLHALYSKLVSLQPGGIFKKFLFIYNICFVYLSKGHKLNLLCKQSSQD